MKIRKLIKQSGKRCLYNNWGKAVAITLLLIATCLFFLLVELMVTLIFGAPPVVDVGNDGWYLNNLPNTTLLSLALTAILTIGSLLIIAPLQLGVTAWNYGISEGRSPEVLHVFHCFSNRNYFRSLTLKIHLWGRKLFLLIPFFLLPGAVIGASLWCLSFGPTYLRGDLAAILGSCGLLFGGVLAILFAIFYGIHIQKYFLAEYYVVNENCGAWSALKKSRHASRGKRGEIFLFRLSWLPWFLSCLLVVPCIYVLPYYNISAMLYARVLMESHSRSTKLVPVSQPPVTEEEPVSEDTQIFDFTFDTDHNKENTEA